MQEDQGPETEISEACLAEMVEIIHRWTGITIGQNRKAMLYGRLKKRMKAVGQNTFEAYLDYVKKEPEEKQPFIDLVTTNETYFFRTPRVWDHLEKTFIPHWFAHHPGKTFRVLSGAASSGEEAHSLGIICQEFKETHPAFNYQIVGTDISTRMVAKATEGRYSGRSIESFRTTPRFEKYMKADGDQFRVITEIKSRIEFRSHNLFQRLTLEPFDLILLRNVLIYFKGPDQEKVLSNLVPALRSDGLLIIGESESLTHIQTEFESIAPLIYRAKIKKAA
ncbi:MAG: protein-glutamate O-methyltransferase CheR [Bdellovibrionales bacterium]|nr:protein-glutamate O-methyltransferase CheR [Bdellovibrionales bacterium]